MFSLTPKSIPTEHLAGRWNESDVAQKIISTTYSEFHNFIKKKILQSLPTTYSLNDLKYDINV